MSARLSPWYAPGVTLALNLDVEVEASDEDAAFEVANKAASEATP